MTVFAPSRFLISCNCPSFFCDAQLRRDWGRLRLSYTALLPSLVDVEKLRGKEGELSFLVLVGKGSFHPRLLRCLSSREKSGVAEFCLAMVEMGSYLGAYGPDSSRAGRALCYSYVHKCKTLHFSLLFINSLITLNTTFNWNKIFLTFMWIWTSYDLEHHKLYFIEVT
jgi:hypothetical protein